MQEFTNNADEQGIPTDGAELIGASETPAMTERVLLVAPDNAVRRMAREALTAHGSTPDEVGSAREARRLIADHGALDATRAEALRWSKIAKAAVATLPEHALRTTLSDLADYVVARVT